jgi:aspartate/glutamate racemase
MMNKLAIIHTTSATVEPLQNLAHEILSGIEVVNFVDDSILPQLADNGGRVSAVEHRLIQYAVFAEEVGADVILEACSSVGEAVPSMRERVSVPVVRIDEAMAEEAVARGSKVGVAATLNTTLKPTVRLLKAKAKQVAKDISLETTLADEAYQKLMAGDQEGHDDALAEKLLELVHVVDVVVLAQASMARVIPSLPADVQGLFLTSPQMGMERVREVLRGEAADKG